MNREAATSIFLKKDCSVTDLVEVSLTTSCRHGEQVEEIFFASGAGSVTIESAGDEVCFDGSTPRHAEWEHQRIRALFEEDCLTPGLLQQVISEMGDIPGVHALATSRVAEQDWETVWHERFHPLEVGRRLLISPTWCTPDCRGRTVVWIDPGLAFGTGGHETTRLCLEYLDGMNLRGRSVMDFGCGSGILGIAAGKLGAREVTGVDIDPRAVETANRNGRINRIEEIFRALPAERFVRRRTVSADVVIANILAGTLVDLSEQISSLVNDQGTLMLSGILNSQTDTVLAAYGHCFRFQRLHAGDWVLLTGEKTDG